MSRVQRAILFFNKPLEADRQLRPAADVISRREALTTRSRADRLSTLLGPIFHFPIAAEAPAEVDGYAGRHRGRSTCPVHRLLFDSGVCTDDPCPTRKRNGPERARSPKDSRRFTYISEERSTRTGGHLWTEKVVETKDGLFRRLIAEDGKPLASGQAKAEEQHLAYLVAHPEAFRRLNQNRKDDQERAGDLLRMLPTAFLFEDGDIENGCERIAFRPDPHFQPATFEQRVLHAMAGTVLMTATRNAYAESTLKLSTRSISRSVCSVR